MGIPLVLLIHHLSGPACSAATSAPAYLLSCHFCARLEEQQERQQAVEREPEEEEERQQEVERKLEERQGRQQEVERELEEEEEKEERQQEVERELEEEGVSRTGAAGGAERAASGAGAGKEQEAQAGHLSN